MKKKLKTQLEILGIEAIVNTDPVTLEDVYGKDHLEDLVQKLLKPVFPFSVTFTVQIPDLVPSDIGDSAQSTAMVPSIQQESYPAPDMGYIDA